MEEASKNGRIEPRRHRNWFGLAGRIVGSETSIRYQHGSRGIDARMLCNVSEVGWGQHEGMEEVGLIIERMRRERPVDGGTLVNSTTLMGGRTKAPRIEKQPGETGTMEGGVLGYHVWCWVVLGYVGSISGCRDLIQRGAQRSARSGKAWDAPSLKDSGHMILRSPDKKTGQRTWKKGLEDEWIEDRSGPLISVAGIIHPMFV